MVVNYGSDHISNWTCYVYNLLKSGHNFGQMSFFSGTLIRTDVAFGQMSLSDRSRVTLESMSPASEEAERAFSAAGLFLTKIRSRLSDSSLLNMLCVLRHSILNR